MAQFAIQQNHSLAYFAIQQNLGVARFRNPATFKPSWQSSKTLAQLAIQQTKAWCSWQSSKLGLAQIGNPAIS
jgi:hypothetical protein